MVSRLKVETLNPLLFPPDECPVCLNKMWTRVTLSCGHQYHLKCIGAWFLKQENCPYCRHPFSCPPSFPPSPRDLYRSQSSSSVTERFSEPANVCCVCFGWRLNGRSQTRQRERSLTY